MEVLVETDRMVLRRFTRDDLELLVELDSDPQVKQYIDNGAVVDRGELADMLDWWLGYYERFAGYGFWAAIDKATGRFLGWFHLRPGDGAGPDEPELGYRLRRDVWGHGFATEGSRALIDKAFADLGAERIYAETMAVHTASRRVMEKSGLRHVRTFESEWPVRIPGDEGGDVEYAITRSEWENDNSVTFVDTSGRTGSRSSTSTGDDVRATHDISRRIRRPALTNFPQRRVCATSRGSAMSAQTPWRRLMPEQPADFQMPFWYSSLLSLWLYYPVRRDMVEALLPELPAGHRLRVAEFGELDEQALVSLDFQAYTSGGSNFLAFTREVEFNIYVYPESRLPAVPLMSWQEYLRGRDQTKTIGGFRLHVPCDNPIAVQAGRQNFGEPKWLASFQYAVPSPNAPDVNTWSYGVYEPSDPSKPPPADALIFQVDADLRGTPAVTSNLSPLIEYGTRTIDGREVVAANFWNFFGWFDTYFFDDDAARKVKLHLGPSIDKYRLRQDVQSLIGTTPPIAAQTFSSAPVSSEAQAWMEDPND